VANKKKFTPELGNKICALVRAGNYVETAMVASGITRQTLMRWLRAGKAGESKELVEFNERYSKACAESEALFLGVIQKSAAEHWQAAAWILERRFPEKWGKRERVDVAGVNGAPLATSKNQAQVIVLPAFGAKDGEPVDG
jgi:hypothetical protein